MDTTTDRFGHSRLCAYGIGVAETGRVVEVVLAGRAEAEARAAELTRRHAEAARLAPEFWAESSGRLERERNGTAWDEAMQARWLSDRGVHAEDREFVRDFLVNDKVRISVPYDVFPLPLSPLTVPFQAPAPCTPGEILREQIAQRAREKLSREQQASEAALAKARRHKQIIRDALTSGLADAITTILAGRPLVRTKLPREFQDYSMNGVTVSSDRHPDHHIFVEFEGAARIEGLVPLVSYQHDGGGMESWHELGFVPA